jgi:hypothetical protein
VAATTVISGGGYAAMRYADLTLLSQSSFLLRAMIAALLLIIASCRVSKPLSPCRAAALKHAGDYISRHVPDSQWQPIIEAELERCIEQEKK